jgi:hypothetical protein
MSGARPRRSSSANGAARQQLREPGMEGTDLDRPAGREDAAVQGRERVGERLGTPRRDAAQDERRDALGMARARRGMLREPLVQPLPHLAGGGAREGDGEDLVRRDAFEQRAQHARDQHPGLARAGARLDHAAAGGIAGDA